MASPPGRVPTYPRRGGWEEFLSLQHKVEQGRNDEKFARELSRQAAAMERKGGPEGRRRVRDERATTPYHAFGRSGSGFDSGGVDLLGRMARLFPAMARADGRGRHREPVPPDEPAGCASGGCLRQTAALFRPEPGPGGRTRRL